VKSFLFLSLVFLVKTTQAFTYSGVVTNQSNSETVIGCLIYLKSTPSIATSTDINGYYSIDVGVNKDTLVFSSISFTIKEFPIQPSDKNVVLNVSLNNEIGIDVVEINEIAKENTKSVKMSTIELDMEDVKKLPAFMGEVDVLKTIQLMPGVQSGGEGNSGFYVRGGGPDQNLILLDGATVYNASHLFGFFSVFNADAIRNIKLTKGGMPANFGGRLSSVLEVNMNEGDLKNFKYDGGIGLIASRFTIQGPLKKDTSSFLISGRRTYIDVLTKPFLPNDSQYGGSGYFFYDLNAKVNYKFSDKDHLFLSGYYGKDEFKFGDSKAGFKAEIPWGNGTGALRWKHVFNEKLFLNTALTFSDYEFEFGATQSDFDFSLYSGVRDYSLKADFSYLPNKNHKIKFGGDYTYHIFIPNNATARSGDVEFDLGGVVKQYAQESSIYVLDEFGIGKRLKFNVGLRFGAFSFIGPFDRYLKDEIGVTNDTVSYGTFENIKTHSGLEPRISARLLLSENASLKASYTRNLQYLHLASMASVSLPTDLWVPSSDIVKPQKADQYVLGYFQNLFNDQFETSVEVYYKTMDNLVEFGEGELPDNNINDNVDNGFVFGSGLSYGAEFFIKKRLGKFTGWVGYTWSKTTRTFEEINLGKTFVAKYDRRHDLSIVLNYEFNNKWNASAVFVFATGNALTIPESMMLIGGDLIQVYGPRNGFRMPDYHRADISVTYVNKETDKYKSSWNFSVYNIYNRMNPYFIYFNQEGDLDTQNINFTAKQVSLFPVLPSVTWNFSF
jgi:hypothetical protein